jgi:pimeloyl-ACP methyl ester carboxylesterase
MQHPDYHEIGKRFRQKDDWNDTEPLVYEKEGVDLYYLECLSRNAGYLLGYPQYECGDHGLHFGEEPTPGELADCSIEENIRFRYPLLRAHHTGKPQRSSDVLILLHGLNERSFTKYIPWAYQVWSYSRMPVLLFPLSFHINRVRRAWGQTQQESYRRRFEIPGNEHAHRFNAVMSDRLYAHPERFIWGALQSYWDIVDLVGTIRAGRHPHFEPDTRVHLMGFSAGGYIALSILLENSFGWFDKSRAVMFATCAAIRDVNLASNLIIDHAAEVALVKMYVKYREKQMNGRLTHWLEHHPEGRWFNAFCGLMPDRKELDQRLREVAPRLLGIANTNDQVMTPGAMLNALQGIRRNTGVPIRELNLGIHENPFATPDYHQRERQMITEFLDVKRFGAEFEQFIEIMCNHLQGS